jgi:hypothetical protein
MKFDIITQWVLLVPQVNRESPTCPKRSQPDSSEPHVLSSNGWCEAGVIKDAGSVLSSEISIVVVIGINRHLAVKADAFDAAEGSSPESQNCGEIPDCDWVRPVATLVFRTPPESETRSCVHRGNLETWESRLSP